MPSIDKTIHFVNSFFQILENFFEMSVLFSEWWPDVLSLSLPLLLNDALPKGSFLSLFPCLFPSYEAHCFWFGEYIRFFRHFGDEISTSGFWQICFHRGAVMTLVETYHSTVLTLKDFNVFSQPKYTFCWWYGSSSTSPPLPEV